VEQEEEEEERRARGGAGGGGGGGAEGQRWSRTPPLPRLLQPSVTPEEISEERRGDEADRDKKERERAREREKKQDGRRENIILKALSRCSRASPPDAGTELWRDLIFSHSASREHQRGPTLVFGDPLSLEIKEPKVHTMVKLKHVRNGHVEK